ncbi:MAG: sugar-binding protein [Lentisphaeria bacterium]
MYILGLAVLAGACQAGAPKPGLVDDFNGGGVTWETWAPTAVELPALAVGTDAAEGTGALVATFPKSGDTSLIARKGIVIPPDCDAVALWVKRLAGAPGCHLVLEQSADRSPKDADGFRAVLPVPENGQWARVVLPFREFVHVYGNGKPVLAPAQVFMLQICAYHQAPFTLAIDQVEFVKAAGGSGRPAAGAAKARNLLAGNSSFETGTGSWRATGGVDETTGAVGRRSLKWTDAGGASRILPTGVLRADRPHTLSFYAKATPGADLHLNSWMGYSCILNQTVRVPAAWTRFTLPIPAQAHPIGATLSFGFTQPGATMWLDGIQVEEGAAATPYEDADPVCLQADAGGVSGIIRVQETLPLKLAVGLYNARCPEAAQPLSLYCQVTELSTGPVSTTALSLRVPPGQTVATQLELLPRMRPGYYVAKLVLRDRAGALLKSMDYPIAVVREPAAVPVDRSFFGLHIDGVDAVGAGALHAIGVKWLRHGGALWDATEPERGKFSMPGVQIVKKDGFGALVTMQTVPPPAWALGKDGFPAAPELITGYIDRVLATYGREIQYYDFQNEPDLTLPKTATAAASFAALLKTAHSRFRGTGDKLVFDISGDGLGLAAEVMKLAPGACDVFAPHPYSNPRYLGPGGMASGPELGGMQERLAEAGALFKTGRLGNELWIGELGWALDAAAPVDSPWALRHAAYLARAFLVARAVPEMRRVIWFRDIGCVEGGHYEYGLWRDDEGVLPLPAAAAYATVAKLLDGSTPLPPVSDRDIKLYAFKNNGKIVLAVWDATEDDALEPLQIELPAAEAEVWTMTGAAVPRLPGAGDRVRMTVGAAPVYAVIEQGALEAFAARIRAAIQSRRPVAVTVGLPELGTLSLSLRNGLDTPYAGTLDIAVARAGGGPAAKVATGLPVALPAGGALPLTVPLKPPLPTTGGTLEFALVPAGGGPAINLRKMLPAMLSCPRQTGGAASVLAAPLPAAAARLLVLEQRNQVLPADPTIGWKGPENLSARAAVSWDAQYLYFAADVTDNVHVQKAVDGEIWTGDAIQLAIDGGNDAQPNRGYDNNDSEYGLALGPAGQPVVWRWQAPAGIATGLVAQLPVRVERQGTRTVYRIAVPWRDLGIQPRPGRVFGLNFIVPDNDGHGREFWIGLTPGIAEAKLPAFYKKFVLTE